MKVRTFLGKTLIMLLALIFLFNSIVMAESKSQYYSSGIKNFSQSPSINSADFYKMFRTQDNIQKSIPDTQEKNQVYNNQNIIHGSFPTASQYKSIPYQYDPKYQQYRAIKLQHSQPSIEQDIPRASIQLSDSSVQALRPGTAKKYSYHAVPNGNSVLGTLTVNAEEFTPQVSFDNELLRVGEENTITLTATLNGSPMANAFVEMYGSGINVNDYTNSYGKLTLTLKPDYWGYIDIYIEHNYAGDNLYAVSEDIGVARVSGMDLQSRLLQDIVVKVVGPEMGQWRDCEGSQAAVFAQPGTNELIFTSKSTSQNSYYVVKTANIEAGKINDIMIDMKNENLVQADLSFKYLGIPMDGYTVSLEKNDRMFWDANSNIGPTDASSSLRGGKRIYLSPGNYKVIFYHESIANGLMCLTKNDVIINSSGAREFNWASEDVGKLGINITGINVPIEGRTIFTDNIWIDLYRYNQITLNRGTYNIDAINVKTNINNDWREYDFWNRDPGTNAVTVDGSGQIYNYDLGIKDISINTYNSNIKPGQRVRFEVDLTANCGYVIEWSNKYVGMDVKIVKPDGQEINFGNQYFRDGYFELPGDSPDGKYTLACSVDFTGLYGIQNVTKTINISRPQVTFSNNLLKVGVESKVALTAKNSDGIPIANNSIEMYGPGIEVHGETDGNGQFETTLTPQDRCSVDIFIGGNYVGQQLFALYDDEGVVRVKAKDIQGNGMQYFYTRIDSPDMNWWNDAQDYQAVLFSKGGVNELILANWDYYLVKDINTIPGEINDITIDMSQEGLVKANFEFGFDGALTDASEIEMEKIDSHFGNTNSGVGPTGVNGSSRGTKTIYMTPGSYRVKFKRENVGNELMYLIKNIAVGSSGTYSLDWLKSDTGKITLNLSGIQNTIQEKSLFIDNTWIFLNGYDAVRINNGNYSLDAVGIRIDDGGYPRKYDFWMNGSNPVTVNGDEQVLNYDLGFKDVSLNIYSQPVRKGETVRFGIDALTNAGFMLGWSDRFIGMNVDIILPNGDIQNLGEQHFGNGWYDLPAESPDGVYKINCSVDFGANLGAYNLSAAFSTFTPILTFDKTLLRPDEPNTVTMTASLSDNTPLANTPVEMYGPNINIRGTTDDNGQFTTTLYPQGRGTVDIAVGGYFLRQQLFSIYDDEGVVRVSAVDKQNNPVSGFFTKSVSRDMDWWTDTDSGKASVIAKTGTNELIFAAWSNQQNSYYVVKNISVTAGEINDITIDMNSENLVQADFQLKYGGSGINAYSFTFDKTDSMFNRAMAGVGETDANTNLAGTKRVFMTPGNYKVIFSHYSDQYGLMCLSRAGIAVNSSKVYELSWLPENTGKVELNLSGINTPIMNKSIFINNMWVDMFDGNSVTVDKGTYPFGAVKIEIYEDNDLRRYEFWRNSPNVITINSGDNIINCDLGINDIGLYVSSQSIEPGQNIYFGTYIVTNSGFILDNCDKYIGMNVSIVKPDGSVDDLGQQYFRNGSYELSPDAQEGSYRICADVDLSPVYGTYRLESEFNVFQMPNVSINTNCIAVGETRDIIITVKDSNNNPVQGKQVILGGYGEQTTDAEGRVIFTICALWKGEVIIYIGPYEFRNMLYAVNADEGLVEVRFKDINGTNVSDFGVIVKSDQMEDRKQVWGDVARSIAKGGSNVLIMSKGGEEGTEGYYISKTIDVRAGEVNYITFDASDPINGVVRANLTFTNNSNPVVSATVSLENLEMDIDYLDQYVGRTDMNGSCTVFVTPGQYREAVQTGEKDDTIAYLTRNIIIDRNDSYNASWSDADTGRLVTGFTGICSPIKEIGINIRGQWIWMKGASQVIMNRGVYDICEFVIKCSNSEGNGELEYHYIQPWGNFKTAAIGGTPYNFNVDIAIEKSYIEFYTNNVIHEGEIVRFGVNFTTKSGYKLQRINYGDNCVDMEISRPDGQKENYYLNRTSVGYVIDPNSMTGKYTITLRGDYGLLYGANGGYNISRTFYGVDDHEFRVVDVLPQQNEFGMPNNNQLAIVLSRNLSNVDMGLIRITKADGEPVTIMDSRRVNNILSLTLDSELVSNTTYNISILRDGIYDEAGERLAADFIQSITVNPQPVIIYGDANRDSIVDYNDSTMVKNFVLNRDNLLTEDGEAAVDVDGDGKITSTDYALIIRYLKGKITKFPIEN